MPEIHHNWSRFGSAIWAVKMAFLSVGIMSTFILFRVAIIPYASSTAVSVVSAVPAIATSIRSWLSPPYIYIILNFIILVIAAQNHLPLPTIDQSTPLVAPSKDEFETTTIEKSAYPPWETSEKSEKINSDEQNESSEEPNLEETWTKIIEAQEKAQTRQLKKSETWDTPPRVEEDDPAAWARRELSKSSTFKETASMRRREKSMSQEELNRRAEAFIKKFKLQRLESHQRALDLVNAVS